MVYGIQLGRSAWSFCRLIKHTQFTLLVLLMLPISLDAFRISPCRADDQMQSELFFSPPSLKEFQDVELVGDWAIVFGVGGLFIVDRHNFSLIGRYEQSEDQIRLFRGAVGPNHIYAGGRDALLYVIDISNPAEPHLATVHGSPGMSYEGAVIGDGYLYAARHDAGVEVLDLTDPAAPVMVAELPALQNSWDAAFKDNYLLVADGGGGLAVLDITDPTTPVHLYSLPTSGAATDICVEGDLAAVALGSAGVDILDVADPTNIAWLGNFNTSGLAMSLAATGDTLYVADWDDVEVIDLSFPESPSRMGFEFAPVRAMGLAAWNERVYLADWSIAVGYQFGTTYEGDVHLPFRELTFAGVPVGDSEQQAFQVMNTGGGPLTVDNVETFGSTFTVEPPSSFVVPAGEIHEVILTFTPDHPGFDGTFVRVETDDADESTITFPVTADDNPSALDLGEAAPGFTYEDLDGTLHSLSNYLGQVVVLAFFSNW